MRNNAFATGLIPVIFAVLLTIPVDTSAQMTNTGRLTFEEAKTILEAAETRAGQDNWTVAIAIVDAGGHLMAFSRKDGTQLGSISVALEKAKASVYYRRPTKSFQESLQGGNTSIMTLPNISGFEGGEPIEHNGEVIGAVGVSGVMAAQDGIIARAGVNALAR